MQTTYTTKEQDNLSSAIRQGEEKVKDTICDSEQKLREKQDQLKQYISIADKNLHENPWPIVTGVAVGCLLVGFLAGRQRG